MHKVLKDAIAKTCGVASSLVVLEKPKDRSLGHYATPLAFALAKLHKNNPHNLANDLSQKLLSANSDMFEKVEALNGFINITLSTHFLAQSAKAYLQTTSAKANSSKSILLEFVSANPTGGLHIGHARGAIYGDVLARVGRFLGYDITTEYYINDAGSQIDMLGNSILLVGKERLLKEAVSYPEQYYRGEYVLELANEALSAFGKDIFKSADSIPTLAQFGKDRMLKEIKDNLKETNITFDNFVSEKALYLQWEATLEILKKHGGTYMQDNKLYLASSKKGDSEDRVIVRDSGEPTYLAGDIIYHNDKFKRNFAHYINIWGADHHGYIPRVRAAIGFLGFDEKRLEVLLAQMVSLKKGGEPYKMSKRAGNFILMKDVLNDIGADALRFIFLSKKLDTHLEFDVNALSVQDASNPIFYINYANARIHTLFSKAHITLDSITSQEIALDMLSIQAKDLLFLSLNLPQVLESAFNTRELQKICDYLKALASAFHSFYNSEKILDSNMQGALLYVLVCVSFSITLGLNMLGIEAKRKM